MYILIAGVFFTEGNIFAYGFAEQESLLRDETNIAPQKVERIIAHRFTVDQYRRWRSIVDAGNQADQSRLSGPSRTHDGQAAARRNPQVHVMQDRRPVVSEVKPAKLDLPTHLCGVCRAGALARRLYLDTIFDLRLLHQNFVDTRHGRCSTLKDIDHPA